ncbi:hypothetical protein, variant [Aphanomyces invadans]|uniref:Bromo domain-containing protein n=2 Tax=Aphanomyces invadans TaxID=157072 RepID=A0A024UH49_9STRA|nr:hypothetical protein, variant [Aphanomyces invadans]ETW05207.1 hypothetical protein, variant [Aphanomyces invadans]|eukprot:XP_008866644.1 hypothetical protein, variant [Aphanomyces invadans]
MGDAKGGGATTVLSDGSADAGTVAWLPGVKALHKELMNHALAWPFLEPVDPIKLNIPTYFHIIERPMDFGTMQNKLDGTLAADMEGEEGMTGAFGGNVNYASLDEYKQDLFLVFRNAIKFNADDGRVDSVGYILNESNQPGNFKD